MFSALLSARCYGHSLSSFPSPLLLEGSQGLVPGVVFFPIFSHFITFTQCSHAEVERNNDGKRREPNQLTLGILELSHLVLTASQWLT